MGYYQRAARLYERECAAGYPPSCLAQGLLLRERIRDDAGARRVFRDGCDLGMRTCCDQNAAR